MDGKSGQGKRRRRRHHQHEPSRAPGAQSPLRRAAAFAVERLEERRLLAITFSGVADRTVTEGAGVDLSGVVLADDPNDAQHRLRINWGDGTAEQTISFFPDPDDDYQAYPIRSHLYARPGDYTVALTAWASATPADTVATSFAAHVAAAAPVIRVGATPARVSANQTVTLKLDVQDPGGDHVSAWDVDWGDGSSASHYTRDASAPANPEPTPTHAYASLGRHVVTVTPTDTDYPSLAAIDALTFDGAFGVGGVVRADLATTHPWDYAQAIARAATGELLVGGVSDSYVAVGRFLGDGSLDTSFGTAGKARLDVSGGSAGVGTTVSSMAVQADGKILVAGDRSTSGAYDFLLARFNADGTTDTSFGTGGFVVTNFGTDYDRANAIALAADGTITLAGFAGPDVAVARYTAAGGLDSTFGTGGKVTANMGSTHDIGYAVGIDSLGRVAVAGRTDGDLFVARFLGDGTADASFNTTGRKVASPGSNASVAALAFDADDSIVVGGAAGGHAAILRVTEGGAMDSLVGDGAGFVTAAAFDAAPSSMLRSISVDAQGRILAGGNLGNTSFLVARYHADGTPDDTFGGGATGGGGTGWASAYISPNRGEAVALGVLSDGGQVTAVGTSLKTDGHWYDFAVARFLGDNAVAVYGLNVRALSAESVRVGDLSTVSASFSDGDDVGYPHTATVDWGDGTPVEAAVVSERRGAGNAYATHAYDAPGTYSATLTVTDGTVTVTRTSTKTVTSAAPSLATFSIDPITEGDAAFVSAKFADADPHDAHAATIDWGDGNDPEPARVGEDGGAGSAFGSHAYADNGTYTVTVTVRDRAGSGQSATRTASVVVANAAPKVDVGGFVQRFTVGDTIPLAADVFDPGTADTHAYAWTIRDASNAVVATSTADAFDFTPSAVGTYALTCAVTDDDGATGSTAARLIVLAVGATPGTTPPAAPSGLTLGSVSPDGVALSWTDNSSDEDGFAIEWSSDGDDYYLLDAVPAGTTGYVDTAPAPNCSNTYRVFAYREDTESTRSSEVDATPYTASAATGDDNGGFNDRNTLSQFTTLHGATLNRSVKANDLQFATVPYAAVLDRDVENGSLTLNADGTFSYTPDRGFIGTDTFSYRINNGYYLSEPAEVSIDVVNDPPESQGREKWLDANGEASGAVSSSDENDEVTFVQDEGPRYGDLDFDEQSGAFHYTAGPDFPGYDRFTFHANDGIEDGDAAVVSFRAAPVTGRNLHFFIQKNQWAGFNTEDIPNESVVTSSDGATGTFRLGGPGESHFIYTPAEDFVGTDKFTLVNRINGRDSKPYTITFTVGSGLTTFPPVSAVFYTSMPVRAVLPTTYSSSVTRLREANPDARVALAADANHGHVTLSAEGAFTYTPDDEPEEFAGWDYFSFKYTGDPYNTQVNWVALEVGTSPLLQAPPPPRGDAFSYPLSVQGLASSYEEARRRMKKVTDAMEIVGRYAETIGNQEGDPTDLQADELDAQLKNAENAYDAYLQQVDKAHDEAGAYMRKVWQTSEAEADVLLKIRSLHRDVAGIRPTKAQAARWLESLTRYGDGAAVMLDHNNLVVSVANTTQMFLDGAMIVGGGLPLLLKLGTKKGIAEVTKAVAKTALQMAVASEVARNAEAIAEVVGIDPKYIRYAAIAWQAFQLTKMARLAYKMRQTNCFVAGTDVLAGSAAQPGVFATKRIEDVRVGDSVWSKDQDDPAAPLELKKVTEVFAHRAYDLQSVTLADAAGRAETVRVTDLHPFYVQGGGWVGASSLHVGDRLLGPDGRTMTVTANDDYRPAGGATVYNFTVEGDHTYFVADGGGAESFTWVHNSCPFAEYNITEHALQPKHNWDKLFPGKPPTLAEIRPIVEEALSAGNWTVLSPVHGTGGPLIGEKLQTTMSYKGARVWVTALKRFADGKIIVQNAGVE